MKSAGRARGSNAGRLTPGATGVDHTAGSAGGLDDGHDRDHDDRDHDRDNARDHDDHDHDGDHNARDHDDHDHDGDHNARDHNDRDHARDHDDRDRHDDPDRHDDRDRHDDPDRDRGKGRVQGHTHDHAASAGRSRLITVLTVTAAILVAEVIGAAASGSLSLLADAGHMLTDVAGLALAVAAASLSDRPADDRRTWGFRRAEVLSAAAQASVLLVLGLVVLLFAVRHLISPPAVDARVMGVFGVVAVIGNLASLGVLASSRQGNLNLRAAFLEVLNDALGGVAVTVAAIVIAATGFRRADALASMLIAVLILPRTWQLLRETVDVLLESTPVGVDLAEVREHLLEVEHVLAVHDLHATTIASHLPVLTAHVVVEDGCFSDGHCPAILDELQACLAGHFDVEHSTFQFEPATHAAHEHAHP